MDALQRGVKVTIVFPDKADHLLTKATALSYLKKMKKSGAAIYLYKDGFFMVRCYFSMRAFVISAPLILTGAVSALIRN
ncbi:hypothetical protein JCM21714_1548 [Gracilibacillus boraciitolerans JCM 21714]|uniref:Uncharacterized protein n=1 Tax=Gracilibacillus boraciitolerans JCM 21714 TaxID=1298598 RepID=W4VHB6_9BACI|nr:hypothetical protein [Gracilibacillus boraciitolerans]GAE92541.1 hypothetical protein JCM21714_1548 [Gracilibacillus boraciitolerans JCM 21714]